MAGIVLPIDLPPLSLRSAAKSGIVATLDAPMWVANVKSTPSGLCRKSWSQGEP
jgi:hypothetical protein